MIIPTKKYNHFAPAQALFFKNKELLSDEIHQAIRLEVPELGKEFSDGDYIGKGAFSFTWIIKQQVN